MELQSAVSSPFPVLGGAVDLSLQLAYMLRPSRGKSGEAEVSRPMDSRPAHIRIGSGKYHVNDMFIGREGAGGTRDLEQQEMIKVYGILGM